MNYRELINAAVANARAKREEASALISAGKGMGDPKVASLLKQADGYLDEAETARTAYNAEQRELSFGREMEALQQNPEPGHYDARAAGDLARETLAMSGPGAWERMIANRKSVMHATRTREYAQAFWEHLASGGAHVGAELVRVDKEMAALYSGSDTAGGYLLPSGVHDSIITQLPAQSEILSLVTVVEADSDKASWPRVQPADSPNGSIYTSAGVSTMIGELPDEDDGLNEQKFGMFEFPIKEGRYQSRPSLRIVQDVPSLQNFLIADASQNMALLAECQLLAGNGIGNNVKGAIYADGMIAPTDISGTTADQVSNDTTDAGSAPKLLDWFYSVPAQYRNRPGFRVVWNSDTQKKVRKLVDSEGDWLWNHGFGGTPGTFEDKPITVSEFMPSGGTNNNIVGLAGDLSAIYFGVRDGMRAQVLKERFYLQGQIAVVVHWRFGSGVANPDAIRLADV